MEKIYTEEKSLFQYQTNFYFFNIPILFVDMETVHESYLSRLLSLSSY